MKQTVTEFTIALGICWLAFAALSGCIVEKKEVYSMITKTKVTRSVASIKGE